jgi:cytochrome P450
MIISNVLLAIVAGSDTTSSAISNAIYLMLSHPETYKRLKEEVKDVFEINEILNLDEDIPPESSDTGTRYKEVLAGMEYLNAVM